MALAPLLIKGLKYDTNEDVRYSLRVVSSIL
jgi:hypothetical protein